VCGGARTTAWDECGELKEERREEQEKCEGLIPGKAAGWELGLGGVIQL
jgi:hypothetical protein